MLRYWLNGNEARCFLFSRARSRAAIQRNSRSNVLMGGYREMTPV